MRKNNRNFLLGRLRIPVAGFRSHVVYSGDAHMLVIAENGKGKTRPIAIPNLIRHTGSAIVMDCKGGELTIATALYRAAVLGQEVYVYDPFGIVDKKYIPTVNGKLAYAKLDPLDYVGSSCSPFSAAFKVAEPLMPPSLKETHWSDGSQAAFVGVVLFVKFDELFEAFDMPRTMQSVWALLSDPVLETRSLKLMVESGNKFVADQANNRKKAGKNNTELANIRNQIRVGLGKTFAEPAIFSTLGETNVRFVEMKQRPITCYLVMPGDLAVTHNKMLKLYLTICLSEIERSGLVRYGSSAHSILVQLDEFAALGANFNVITDAMARYRGFGVKFQTFVQNLGQIKQLYGDGFSAVVGNASSGSLQYFGGTNDKFTADYISELCGTKTESSNSWGQPVRAGENGTYTQSESSRRLYTPDEIMRLPLPEQIIKFTGQQPMREYLLDPSLIDFPEYLAFQECIEQGFDHADARDFAARYRHTVVNGTEPSPRRVAAPAPPKRQHITFGRIFRELMGHDE